MTAAPMAGSNPRWPGYCPAIAGSNPALIGLAGSNPALITLAGSNPLLAGSDLPIEAGLRIPRRAGPLGKTPA
jgi:hypothetical protein